MTCLAFLLVKLFYYKGQLLHSGRETLSVFKNSKPEAQRRLEQHCINKNNTTQ